MQPTRYGSIIALGAALALGACSKGDRAPDSAAAPAAAAMPTDSTAAMATPDSGAAPGAMGTASVAAMIGLTNADEIAMAKLAEERATNADVKAFAKQMLSDHQAMQHSLDSLTSAMSVTPSAPAAADQQRQMSSQTVSTLQSTEKGIAFDRAYMDAQVQAHQQALNDLQGFSTNAPDPQLKQLIDAAIPKVQSHLDKAQQLQAKLSSGA